jgi:hypothetical protein
MNNISHSEVCQLICIRFGDFKVQSNISLLHITSYESKEINLFLYMPGGHIQGMKEWLLSFLTSEAVSFMPRLLYPH